MKSEVASRGWVRRAVGILAILALLAVAMGASGQVPEALVRGSFSDGNGSWNAESFGWFYYDLDDGTGGERLTIEAEGREVKEGHLVYSSEVWTEEFDFDEWGSYQAVAFLGKRYLAGYPESNFTDAVSALEDGELWQVVQDSDAVLTATSEEPLVLGGGYWIEVGGVSSEGNEVYLILKRYGIEVDRAVVRVGDTYVYEAKDDGTQDDVDGDDDFPLILAHVSEAMEGSNKDIVDFNGIFQVLDFPTYRLEAGEIVGLMEVATLSERKIELENAEDLVLRRDSTINLVGNLMLRVRDTPELIYYPQGAITEYGVYEIRGPVFSENYSMPTYDRVTGEITGYAPAKWNYTNFSGFYFYDDEDVGSESLILFSVDDRLVASLRAQYSSNVQNVDFEVDDWGSYEVISFLGDIWFAGFGPTTVSDIEEDGMFKDYKQISRILIDTELKDKLTGGGGYLLQEGYQISIRDVTKGDVEDDRIFIELSKNNQFLESVVIEANSTYIYKADVGDMNDVPIILLKIGSIFRNESEQFVMIDGLFQISDSQYLPVESYNDFGELTVVQTSDPNVIFMTNDDDINLKRDSVVGILPGMYIAVADNDSLRYYIFKNEYVLPPPEIVNYYLPKEPVPSGGKANFSIFVLAGDILSVSAETVDSQGRRVILGDLTAAGIGDRDQWLFSWQWNATVSTLSDDGSLLPESNVQSGVLKVNNTTEPVQVFVRYDASGWIGLIQDTSGEIYYISPTEYEMLGASPGYAEMASNETLRKIYIKVEPGVSEINFFQVVDGAPVLDNTSHNLWFSRQGIEPHLVRVGALPGRYELRLRVENAMNALQATGYHFDVSGPDLRSATVGSATVAVDERFRLPMAIPASENETKMTLAFDPDHLSFEGIESEECDIGQDQSERGRIALNIPGNCSAFNLVFRADGRGGPSEVEIVELAGIEVDEIVNGTVNVTASQPEGRAPAPGAAFALLAVVVACLAGRRRR